VASILLIFPAAAQQPGPSAVWGDPNACWERQEYTNGWVTRGFGYSTSYVMTDVAANSAKNSPPGYVQDPDGTVYVYVYPRSKNSYRWVRVPCGHFINPLFPGGGVHPFFGGEVGGGWTNTNFGVDPPFSVNGNSFVYGLNGGVLVDIPCSNGASIGPRFGWDGSNLNGSTWYMPTGFAYSVKVNSTFYQEALVRVPINFPGLPSNLTLLFPFVTASVGLAEVHTRTSGTLGDFSINNSTTTPGFTFTGGFGVPIAQFGGGRLDAMT
jgi:hypothetical protein